ncbi:MAG TPA: hypothetical protein VHB21_24700, partial [Minicystis sp.]|nr:hypothetical protein [Minicystis sp.]
MRQPQPLDEPLSPLPEPPEPPLPVFVPVVNEPLLDDELANVPLLLLDVVELPPEPGPVVALDDELDVAPPAPP